MRANERNPRFANPLVNATSPYLRQHAHNPVFWYPWGREALERARAENKPILLSIGYSTCYWCHVMEREVFENLSIASLMNRLFINIKLDREEHPALDDIYMHARQLMTHEGGWPNNVFLTPDLKPFYAGGTYAADDSYGKPAFPRLLEWLADSWANKRAEVKQSADAVLEVMRPYLVASRPNGASAGDIGGLSGQLVELLKQHYDARGGGFFQAPKFPHECYLQFLLTYHEATGDPEALSMAVRSLSKMAAGGIYDHVGGGFHRYAVDKEWYVPHFEKMLYNQAQLARAYTDAARLSGNEWLADLARSVLDAASGPFTDGNGAFYAAFDAETDGVEGAYYAWEIEELQALLTPEENRFFVAFYALADIPAFPGHKHAKGKVIIARKPFDQAAREQNMPYLQLAALSGQVMNKLLKRRNEREPVRLDDKIIVGWNGLMIDAFAKAGQVFERPDYTARARKAADFLLEHAIDNDGKLHRIFAGGRAQLEATLEDYAFLIKGLLTLALPSPSPGRGEGRGGGYAAGSEFATSPHPASPRPGEEQVLLDAAISLATCVEELFSDPAAPGYFFAAPAEDMLLRIKSGDDSALPNANAAMLENWIRLYEMTGDTAYQAKTEKLAGFFLYEGMQVQPEQAAMLAAALRMGGIERRAPVLPCTPQGDEVAVSTVLFPLDARPGDMCEVIVTLEIGEGWHINAHKPNQPHLIATQLDVQGEGVEPVGIAWPEPLRRSNATGEVLLVYEGLVHISAHFRLNDTLAARPPFHVRLRYQACTEGICRELRDVVISV